MLALIVLATLVQSPIVAETPTLQASRHVYAPHTGEPAGERHLYDEVIIPIDGGLAVTVEGQPVASTPGVPILLSRGAPHRLFNDSPRPLAFVAVRTVGDAPLEPPIAAHASHATIVRSATNKYIRATTLRFEKDGEIQWPATAGDAVLVPVATTTFEWRRGPSSGSGTRAAGEALALPSGDETLVRNPGHEAFEIVRISRAAAR